MRTIILVITSVAMVAFASILGGTVLWLCWHSAMAAFPGLVTSGYLASDLHWWNAVCVSWVFATLFKSSPASSK